MKLRDGKCEQCLFLVARIKRGVSGGHWERDTRSPDTAAHEGIASPLTLRRVSKLEFIGLLKLFRRNSAPRIPERWQNSGCQKRRTKIEISKCFHCISQPAHTQAIRTISPRYSMIPFPYASLFMHKRLVSLLSSERVSCSSEMKTAPKCCSS